MHLVFKRLAALWFCAMALVAGLLLMPAHASDLAMADARFGVGAPVVVGGVAVFPVIAPDAVAAPATVLTLAEALASGKVTITESEGGTVPMLKATNVGGMDLLITAGEVVKGGKQDRVITQDVVVPNDGKAYDLAVNCVEQSRWSYTDGAEFSYGGRAEVQLKKSIEMDKNQGSTWATVSAMNASKAGFVADAIAMMPSTGTYMASLENAELKQQTQADVKVLADGLAGRAKVVGVVVAFSGELTTAEIFGQPSLFSKAVDGVLESVVLEGLGKKDAAAPSKEAAAKFLALALQDHGVAAEAAGAGQRKEARVGERGVFETLSGSGDLLHLSTY